MIKDATKPTTLYFKNNSWFDEERNYYNVVAWQPLPEPYRPDPCHGCFGAANNDCRNCDKI